MPFVPTVALVKKFAAWLLACCFVLPLSTCSQEAGVDQRLAVKESTLYGFDKAREAVGEIAAVNPEGAFTLLVVLCVFFVPALSLRLGAKAQSLICAICAGPACYVLFFWVFVFVTRRRFGGVLAIACWAIVSIASLTTLWKLWRGGQLFRKKASRLTGAARG
ncbi:MAG: hypothetical protein ABIT83_13565 [Massilia sp.]